MAERRARGVKRMDVIEFPAQPESSKTMEQIEAERADEVMKSMMQRAMRIAHCLKKVFPDVRDSTNTECDAYMTELREAVDRGLAASDGSDAISREAERQENETPSKTAQAAGQTQPDALGEAIRAAMPDAPGAGAEPEECEAFAGVLSQVRMEGVTGYANVGKMLKSCCPGLPDVADESACKAYVEELAKSAAWAEEQRARLERLDRMFGAIMALEPGDCKDDPERAAQFEEAWNDFRDGMMSDIKEMFRGAMKNN